MVFWRMALQRRINHLNVFVFMLGYALLFAPGPGFAQVSQPARFELEHESGDNPFNIVSLREEGLSMIRQKTRPEGNKKVWDLVLLDTALQQTWRTDIALDNHYSLVGYEYVPGELYFLFRQGETSHGDLRMVRIYLYTHTLEEHLVAPNIDFRLTHFLICGGSAIFGGYVNRQSTVFLYDMKTNHQKVIPGFFIENTELLEVKSNLNKTFNILMAERGAREKKLLLLRTYDEGGTLLLEDDIEMDPDKTILSGTTSALQNEELFLAGAWAVGSGKQAAGFYTVLADPFNKQQIHYFDFGELQHFFDFMPPKKASRKVEQSRNRRQAGKSPIFRGDIHLVKLDENARGFLLQAELYMPSSNSAYYNNPFYNNSPYYNPYGYNPMLMNRYGYSPYYGSSYPYNNSPYGPSFNRNNDVTMVHSALILFDQHGKRVEDFGMPLHELKVPSLEQVSDFYASDRFVQYYKNEKNIYMSSSWADGSPAELDTIRIKLKSADDVIRTEWGDQGGIRHWFGRCAYLWGYESIKNKKEQIGEKVRYVYYVNKVRME